MNRKKLPFKEFPISSWAIDNRVTIYLLTLVIALAGITSFFSLPKENYPEIAFPVIFVSTPYPGTSAADIENLISRKIEKEVKGIEGIKEISSTSIQDYSSVFVEFETDVDLDEAKREVQEAVDRAKSDLPNDLPSDPQVMDINMSELPIMFLNVSGPYDKVALKKYAEDLQEEIEEIKEILRVDIVGAPEREIQINVDLYKMEAAWVTMANIEATVAGENVIISGGELDIDNKKVAIRLDGEYNTVEELKELVIRTDRGNTVFLGDIAEIKDGFKENDSYARLNGESVITLNVIKKGGDNLVSANDKIKEKVATLKQERYPDNLTVTFSADQSVLTRNTLNELTNTIIIGFILVSLVLMFFMGVRDAIFVGLAVPISSFIAFAILPVLGFTLNLVVLFAFILAMGIVVDNAIVVIENTYRIFTEQKIPIVHAAKKAAGEVIGPVFSGTLTTICPFLPLLFWKGTVGEFMGFLPIVMIITLFASLFVAYVINPVFAVSFMKQKEENPTVNHKTVGIYTAGAVILGIIFHIASVPSLGNLMFFMAAFVVLNAYVLRFAIDWFQKKAIPKLKGGYGKVLRWSIEHPKTVIAGSVGLVVVTMIWVQLSNIKFIQFPNTEPNFIYVYNELPNGTTIDETNELTYKVEKLVNEAIGKDTAIVKSIITNVAIGAGDPMSFDQNSSKAHKSKITVEFVGVKERNYASTPEIMKRVRDKVRNFPGAKVTVGQDENKPPGSEPVEINITSEEFGDLMAVSESLFNYLDSLNIGGIEQWKWDVDEKRPELLIHINRKKARELGIGSGQVGMALRTALFGKEISKFRTLEDEYPIQLRLDEKYRDDINSLMNMYIRYMDMADGMHKAVPISAIADFSFSSEYGGINRTDLEKSVKIYSNVLNEYNVGDVSNEVSYWAESFIAQGRVHKGVKVSVGGQVQDMAEEAEFLGGAFLASIILIFLILVTQFNSFSNVLIILSQVLLSVVGVFLAHAALGLEFSVVLSGMGLVVLAGIVVNNGIILLDYIQLLQKRGSTMKESVIEGGSVRFTPVLLTASSTVLGLVPLAISLNVNFSTLLSSLDPQLFFGGDNAVFWEPFAWSIIFGLSFATIVTLIIVPVLYHEAKRFEAWFSRTFFPNKEESDNWETTSNGKHDPNTETSQQDVVEV